MSPWYEEFKKFHFNFPTAVEHETFDHPVACMCSVLPQNRKRMLTLNSMLGIIAIAATDPNPQKTIIQVFNSVAPSKVYEKGWIDPNILNYCLILHDEHTMNIEE